jgi:hypothetical protein
MIATDHGEDREPAEPAPEGPSEAEDSEPPERHPAGPLFVPVRPGTSGCSARFFRTPLGARTAVGFTSCERLTGTLGADAAWIKLSEPALRALAEPLGVRVLTVDPQFTAPAPAAPASDHAPAASSAPAIPAGAAAPTACLRPAAARPAGVSRRRRPRPRDLHRAGVLRAAGAAVLVSCMNLLIG